MDIIVGGIVEKDNKYLLVQVAKPNCYGKWDIPAGHLEKNETILEGAIREVFEETGCKVEITGVIKIANKKLKDDLFLWIMFSTKLMQENIQFCKSEILAVKWFDYKEIMDMECELRDYALITGAIKSHREHKITPLDLFIIEES